jgi:hypothetical protein
VWTLQDHALVETSGGRSRALPLAGLRSIRLVGAAGTGRRAAHLTFTDGRVMIPAQSLSSAALFEDRSVAFDAFLAALERASGIQTTGAMRAARAAPPLASGLVWGIGLTAAGAVLMMVAALISGMPGLGLALGARLLFAAILLAAALPWLGRGGRA